MCYAAFKAVRAIFSNFKNVIFKAYLLLWCSTNTSTYAAATTPYQGSNDFRSVDERDKWEDEFLSFFKIHVAHVFELRTGSRIFHLGNFSTLIKFINPQTLKAQTVVVKRRQRKAH